MDDRRRKAVPVLPIVILVIATVVSHVTGDVVVACSDGSNKTIDISCGAGSMVRILRAFYGHSPRGSCGFQEGDCTLLQLHDDSQLHGCVGAEACSLPLQGLDEGGVMLPACNTRSNYFQVEYQCVPKSIIHDICSSPTKLTAGSGHIVTPRYPLPYSSALDCNLTIVARPEQKIRVNIVSMELAARGKTDCADLLYFNDGFHSLTLCGRRSNVWYDMHSNSLHVELHSSPGSSSQGFWIYYEADPPMPTTTVTSAPVSISEETTATSEEGEGRGEGLLLTSLRPRGSGEESEPSSPIPVFREDEPPRGAKALPFAAIAGGVIGSLSLVLIVLLMLLLIKWLKERRYLKDERFLEIRNPAFRSSGDFNEANNTYYA